MPQCIGRITKVSGIMHFGNGKNRFYLEYRCPNRQDAERCPRCIGRTTDKIQSSGKFNHGNVNEPVPDTSQIYGGKWYRDRFEKYGRVSDEDIAIAEAHMRAAREEFLASAPAPVAAAAAPAAPIEPIAAPTIIQKPKRKPRVLVNKVQEQVQAVSIPTHIEQFEEMAVDEYEVEEIKLSPFVHEGVTYLKATKNKLFDQRFNYIGRYDPHTDGIRDDIPDSDDES
jgi:hypothetical protein